MRKEPRSSSLIWGTNAFQPLSTASEFAAAFEQVGGFLGNLPSFVEQFLSLFYNLFSSVGKRILGLVSFLDEQFTCMFAGIRRIQECYYRTTDCPRQEPGEAA